MFVLKEIRLFLYLLLIILVIILCKYNIFTTNAKIEETIPVDTVLKKNVPQLIVKD